LGVKVIVNYPDNMEELEDKATEVLANILVRKLHPEEVSQLIEVLKADNCKIRM
jgi:hypothetical protein